MDVDGSGSLDGARGAETSITSTEYDSYIRSAGNTIFTMSLKAYYSVLFFSLISLVAAACHYQSPVFPLPKYNKSSPVFLQAVDKIEAALADVLVDPKFNTSSYSIEVTSSHSTLWSSFHTASDKDPERPGAEQVNGDSAYRIASITKVFTVLGILKQHAAGNLSLDDPVDQYVSALRRPQNGTLPWKDITLKSLASQLSGIPRDWAQGDLLQELKDPLAFGLPPATSSALPQCDSYAEYVPCTKDDLLDYVRTSAPLFAPNQKSTYSNIAFELLGLVLSNVTGMRYEDYIETTISRPLKMTGTSFSKPCDSVAVLPKNESWYWDVDEGVQNPTGGLYASSSDMSQFLRYVLTHYNGITPAMNWFQPASFTAGLYSFYGTPWEIFQTDKILSTSDKAVTFYTKGGGLPGYSTNIIVAPEYDLGITILTGGNTALLPAVREIVTQTLIQAADKIARNQVEHSYTGIYKATHINSSMELSYSEAHGLEITRWISNGTDILSFIPIRFGVPSNIVQLQLIPTLLYRDQSKLDGELWRFAPVLDIPSGDDAIWSDFCVSDVDNLMYDGKPLNEIVFWDKDKDEKYGTAELTAFRVSLARSGLDAAQLLRAQEL
ncbi:hypothetical protein LTS15_001728 [Exophiala xenobiotica]|nr:hypothetical protein LTS15_001728 [Exophiala xenobiotica]